MKTINHNEEIAVHAGPTIAIDTVAAPPSIAETIAQTFGDSTTPPLPGSAGSILPNLFHNPGLANLAAQADDPSSTAPGSSSQADPLVSIAADVTAAMARLTGMDPTNPTDPTQKTGITIGTGLPSADALKAALAQEGMVIGNAAGTGGGSDPSKGESTPSGHPQEPNGPPPDSQESKEESMLSETSSMWSYNYKDAQGHEHQKDMYLDKGYFWVSDKDKTTGEQTDTITQVSKKDTRTTETHSDPKTGETTETTTHTDGRDVHVTVTDTKTGHVKQDSQGVPLAPIDPDPKPATGGGAKTPDGDHQSGLPSWLSKEIRSEIYHEIKSTRPDNHDGDTINVRNDGPDTVSANDITGSHGDKMKTLLGGDTTFDKYSQQGGHVGGTPQPNYNGQAGAIDPGPDGNAAPQTDGPSPRDTYHPIATNPAAHEQNGGHQSSSNNQGQSVHVSTPQHLVETNAAQAAEALANIAKIPSDDPKTHDIASLLGASAPQDDHGGFAALIHAANNPQQLSPQLAAAAHELQAAVLSQLDLGGGSGFGQGSEHTTPDLTLQHATALPPALSEVHHIDLPSFHALHH